MLRLPCRSSSLIQMLGMILCLSGLGSPGLAQDEPDIAHMIATAVFVGSGSGVLISPEGMVLTNHHVSGEVLEQEVRLSDGRRYPARVLGLNPVGDMALLQIQDSGPFPFAQLAEKDELRLGMRVFAVGNPFSLGDRDHIPSLSAGWLSSQRVVRGHYADCLLIDAAVNPGNSGGGLFSAQGRLLGINGQIRTRSGFRANSGIGLAIAAPQLEEFVPALAAAKGGYVHHAAKPEGLALVQTEGRVRVEAADAEGVLRPGDELLKVAGRSVTSLETARGLFLALLWRPGRLVSVEIERQGSRESMQLQLARTPIPGRPWHGLHIHMQHRVVEDAESGLRQEVEEAVIRSVGPDSSAQQAGLQAGMALLSAGGEPVSSVLDLLRQTAAREVGDFLPLRVRNKQGETEEHHLLLRPR